MDEREIWRPVPDYEAVYEVSNFGRVRSLTRTRMVNNSHGGVSPRTDRGRLLALGDNGNGYVFVQFRSNGKRRNYYVHRLVAEVFMADTLSAWSTIRSMRTSLLIDGKSLPEKRRCFCMTDAQATARRMLKKNQQYLSTQQMKTLNGLIKSGDITGAINGLHTLVARKMTARKEGAYGKAKKGNRSEAVREPLRPAMHA